jgi:hypothetical protein
LVLRAATLTLGNVATRVTLDKQLLHEAQRLGGHASKVATVQEALTEYIQRRKQHGILAMFGTVEYEKGHDYKKQRKRA